LVEAVEDMVGVFDAMMIETEVVEGYRTGDYLTSSLYSAAGLLWPVHLTGVTYDFMQDFEEGFCR
jgi:hypothetical protein